jgi:hypothetical protein
VRELDEFTGGRVIGKFVVDHAVRVGPRGLSGDAPVATSTTTARTDSVPKSSPMEISVCQVTYLRLSFAVGTTHDFDEFSRVASPH